MLGADADQLADHHLLGRSHDVAGDDAEIAQLVEHAVDGALHIGALVDDAAAELDGGHLHFRPTVDGHRFGGARIERAGLAGGRAVEQLRAEGARQALVAPDVDVVDGRAIGARVEIDIGVELVEIVTREREGELLGIVAAIVAGEFAVEVQLVERGEAVVHREGLGVGDRQQQDAALERHVLEDAVEIEDGLRAGILVAVDGGRDANRRAILFADQFVDEQHGIAAIGVSGELGPQLVDLLDHRLSSLVR